MLEHEIRGTLSPEKFNKKLREFTNKFGTSVRQKRMAIRIGSLHSYGINLRLRITNGVPEVVQKLGERDAEKREELVFEIIRDVDQIYRAYQILLNLITDPKKRKSVVIQFDNQIFETDAFEIKLAHQTGKSDKYVFEVEAKNDKIDLDKVCSSLGLLPNMREMSLEDWEKWNQELNIDVDSLSEDELKALIKKYLNYGS